MANRIDTSAQIKTIRRCFIRKATRCLGFSVAFLFCMGCLPGFARADDKATELFHPPGLRIGDLWFVRHGGLYHAFYGQWPVLPGTVVRQTKLSPLHGTGCNIPGKPLGYQQVGHATSRDLVRWTDCGPVLMPQIDTWNNIRVSTGSGPIAHEGKWWMAFSGFGTEASGVGLAVSDDLMTWNKVGGGPVVPFGEDLQSTWQGKPLAWYPIGDPYLYPQSMDGWYCMVTNAIVRKAPTASHGCLGMLRSRDLTTWEAFAVVAYPQWFERTEAPQLWMHGDRWYLYFGGAHDIALPPERFVREAESLTGRKPQASKKGIFRGNFVFTADRFEGPYLPDKNCWLTTPGYIYKVFPGPKDRDVLLTTQGGRISPAYPVTYAADGAMIVGKPGAD